jgi:hypothetical protein
MQKKLTFGVWVIIFVVAVIIIGMIGIWPLGLSVPVTIRWMLILAVVIAFISLLGQQIHGRSDGILIDARFKISLSRFQLVLWTLMVFSAFLALALERNRLVLSGEVALVLTDPPASEQTEDESAVDPQAVQPEDSTFNPLDITFPTELLVALGISATSLAGAGLITNTKKESVSNRKVELLNEDRTRYAREQQQAQTALAEASDAMRRFTAEENQLRQEKTRHTEQLNELNKDLAQQETARQQLKQAAEAAPGDERAQESLRQSEDIVNGLRLQIAQTTAQIRRTEASILMAQDAVGKATVRREQGQIAFERATLELERIDEATRNRVGVIYKKESPEQADWLDLFRGDEISNHQIIDVAKVQMFFFTIAIIFTYGVLIWAMMSDSAQLAQPEISFPPFSDTLNALLALSHAGYLVVKSTG